MLANIQKVMPIFTAHYNDIIVIGFIMVSAIIVAIGLLKPILFNKIENKLIRRVSLALASVVACFATVLVYFLINDYGLMYYTESAIALTVMCIVTYWLYEFTCLRELIGIVGKIALKKVANLAFIAVTKDDINEIKTEAKKVANELKTQTQNTLKKATNEIKEDKDLKNL